jgi:HipA-like protein
MRGGAQAHLMRASDGFFYVVKFRNNPQHLRVLANEMLATRLASAVGLPVPEPEVIEVSQWLVAHTQDLRIELAHTSLPCEPGLEFGSRLVISPNEGQIYDYIPAALLERVRNLNTFAGMLAMDKWTCNADGRQAAYWRRPRERKYTVSFIDQGYCFNAGSGVFPIRHCAVFTPAMMSMPGCWVGIHSSPGWAGLNPWIRNKFAKLRRRFRRSGMEIGTTSQSWFRN